MNSDQVEEAKSPVIEVVIPTQKERHASNDTDELEEKPTVMEMPNIEEKPTVMEMPNIEEKLTIEEKPAETQIVTNTPLKVMHSCHIPGCGRMFEQKVLLDNHFDRRHKEQVEKEQMIAQEESKE